MKRFRLCLALIALISLIYGNTLGHSFHFDDIPSILEKPWIRGLDKIPQFIFSFSHRPLVILSFNVNYAISQFQVWSYHLLNIAAHIGVTLLLYAFVRLMGETLARSGGMAPYKHAPAIAAFVFAAHPLNTQSVTYISSRSSIFVTFFYLATLVLLFKGYWLWRGKTAFAFPSPAEEGERAGGQNESPPETTSAASKGTRRAGAAAFYFAAAGAAFVLGGLSKEIIVTLPAMAFLYHFYFIARGSIWRWLALNWKWMVLVGAILAAGLLVKVFFGGGIVRASIGNYAPSSYLLTQTFVIPCEYFWKMFFPFNLSIEIDFPIASDWTKLSSYGGLGLLLSLAAFSLWAPNPWVGFGLAWCLITVLPTSSFLPLLDVAVEHRAYLPLAGFSIFLAGLLGHLAALAPRSTRLRPMAAPLVWTAACLTILLFSAGTVKRNGAWKDELTLWSDAAKKAPNVVRPYNNLGEAYDKLRRFDQAIPQFEKALSLNPNYVYALNNLGNVYGKMKKYDKAAPYFRKALAIKSDYAPASYNLARALHAMGEPEAALEHYRHAVKTAPYFEQAWFNLAHLESELGLFKESTANYWQFIEMQPRNKKAYFGLGAAYLKNRQFEPAIAALQKAVDLDPAYVFPYMSLGAAYLQTGQPGKAIAAYEKTLAIRPDIAGVHKNLGLLYSRQDNRVEKAVFHFKESLRLDKEQPQAQTLRAAIAELEQSRDDGRAAGERQGGALTPNGRR